MHHGYHRSQHTTILKHHLRTVNVNNAASQWRLSPFKHSILTVFIRQCCKHIAINLEKWLTTKTSVLSLFQESAIIKNNSYLSHFSRCQTNFRISFLAYIPFSKNTSEWGCHAETIRKCMKSSFNMRFCIIILVVIVKVQHLLIKLETLQSGMCKQNYIKTFIRLYTCWQ